MKTYLLLLSGFTAMLFLFSSKPQTISFNATYPVNREVLFKYLANPSNYHKINPTIIKISCKQAQDGLEVEYTEHLCQIPWITNTAKAYYSFHCYGNAWEIISTHRTCFFGSFSCVDTLGNIALHQFKNYVHYREDITYNCPKLFDGFCENEIRIQRKLIMDQIDNFSSRQATMNINAA